ncbi:MAG: His/Gly/Thr/Pro-type tRNA ligase C-terminal domain-containing protein [Methanothrix sp.]
MSHRGGRSEAIIGRVHMDGFTVPPQVAIVPILLGDKEKVLSVCRELQSKLAAEKIRVQLDTSDGRPGAKFYKWEMKGVPIRLEVGPRDIEKGAVTLVRRDGAKKTVTVDGLVGAISAEAEELQSALYQKARTIHEGKVKEVSTIEEARAQAEAGAALVPWCGEVECGHQLEDQVGANMLGGPQYQSFSQAACAVCGKKSAGRTYMTR